MVEVEEALVHQGHEVVLEHPVVLCHEDLLVVGEDSHLIIKVLLGLRDLDDVVGRLAHFRLLVLHDLVAHWSRLEVILDEEPGVIGKVQLRLGAGVLLGLFWVLLLREVSVWVFDGFALWSDGRKVEEPVQTELSWAQGIVEAGLGREGESDLLTELEAAIKTVHQSESDVVRARVQWNLEVEDEIQSLNEPWTLDSQSPLGDLELDIIASDADELEILWPCNLSVVLEGPLRDVVAAADLDTMYLLLGASSHVVELALVAEPEKSSWLYLLHFLHLFGLLSDLSLSVFVGGLRSQSFTKEWQLSPEEVLLGKAKWYDSLVRSLLLGSLASGGLLLLLSLWCLARAGVDVLGSRGGDLLALRRLLLLPVLHLVDHGLDVGGRLAGEDGEGLVSYRAWSLRVVKGRWVGSSGGGRSQLDGGGLG